MEFSYSLNAAAQPTPQAVGCSGLLNCIAHTLPLKPCVYTTGN